jgi:hypothetical protein
LFRRGPEPRPPIKAAKGMGAVCLAPNGAECGFIARVDPKTDLVGLSGRVSGSVFPGVEGLITAALTPKMELGLVGDSGVFSGSGSGGGTDTPMSDRPAHTVIRARG